jgi:alpha-ketoglutarate-dependent taurine dioxygenase
VNIQTRVGPSNLQNDANPFLPENESAYHRWRERKIDDYPRSPDRLRVEIGDPRALSDEEGRHLRAICAKTNMVIYRSQAGSDPDKEIPRRIGEQLGLTRLDSNPLADEDAISSLRVMPEKAGRGYIPYSSRRLLWHTDGYYNPSERRIHAFVLHCVQPAARGGENGLLDPEIVYMHLRDGSLAHVRALMASDAMTIPANPDEEMGARPAQSGPVFAVDPVNGCLHMRYTARTRSVVWRDDPETRAAVRALEEILAGGSPYVFHYRLSAGEGLVCNNVLHNRTAFEDDLDSGLVRLMYRARYYDRIAGTALNEI